MSFVFLTNWETDGGTDWSIGRSSYICTLHMEYTCAQPMNWFACLVGCVWCSVVALLEYWWVGLGSGLSIEYFNLLISYVEEWITFFHSVSFCHGFYLPMGKNSFTLHKTAKKQKRNPMLMNIKIVLSLQWTEGFLGVFGR